MMRHQNQKKRTYGAPLSIPTDVAFEQALLAGSVRMLLDVNPLVNETVDGVDDKAGGETYFEF